MGSLAQCMLNSFSRVCEALPEAAAGTAIDRDMNSQLYIAVARLRVFDDWRRRWAQVWRGANSREARGLSFRPAFMDRRSGKVLPSCFGNGMPAPIHLLDGLPEHWVRARDSAGRPTEVNPWVVAGFVRDGRFYTRRQAARAISRAPDEGPEALGLRHLLFKVRPLRTLGQLCGVLR
jgi:hypothetical protein